VRRLRALLLAAAAVLLGYLLAHTLAGGARHTNRVSTSATRARERAGMTSVGVAPRTTTERTTTVGPGPWRVLGGVPLGFARSERGAVAAAGNYLTMLSRALTPGAAFSWERAVRALTVAPLTARALSGSAASATMARRLARSGSSFYLGSWLVGYRVLAYSRSRARVALWSVGVLASAVGVVPPEFSTTTCELRWVDGDWKVSGARVSEGPTPPSTAASDASPAVAFALAARRFSSYSDVP
jgi:hypothetical protein